jgi:hypothetical protein
MQPESVGHGVQHVDARQGEAVDRRSGRRGAGHHDKRVVGEGAVRAVRPADLEPVVGGAERQGHVVELQLQVGVLQVRRRPMGQLLPVRHLAAERRAIRRC